MLQTHCIRIAIFISSSDSSQHVTGYYIAQHGTCHKNLAVHTLSLGLWLWNGSHVWLNHAFFTLLHFLRKSVYMLGNFHRLLWLCKHMPECRLTQNIEHVTLPKRSDWLRDPHKIKEAPGFLPGGKAFEVWSWQLNSI